MRKRWALSVGLVAVLAAAALSFAACGDDEEGEVTGAGTTPPATTTTPGTTTGTAAGPLTVVMSDFKFSPQDATAAAGSVTIVAPNQGSEEHELIVIRTDSDPAALPTTNDEVDEDALDVIGEVEAEPGEEKSVTVTLPAGKYVMVCNIPGHYKKGMYGTLTVN